MPLKVIANTTDFGATMMAQSKLGKPLPPTTRGGGLTIDGKALQAAEQLLAGADDGECFLPVGTGQNSDRQLEISLERLPEPVSEGERSLQGSIRI